MTTQQEKVAVVYDVGAAGPMDMAMAAAGLCELVFVHRRGEPSVEALGGLFAALGTSLDVTGLDAAETAEVLREHKPTGIVTFSEFQLRATAELAALLGLPGNSPQTLAALTDKSRQRSTLAERGVEAVRYALVHTPQEVAQALEAVGTPAVLKPCTGTGSRHTYLVHRAEQAERIVAEVLETARAEGEEITFLLEEYLAGDERWAGPGYGDYLSVESVTVAGETRHLGLCGRFPLAPPFRETGLLFPSSVDESTAELARKLAGEAIAAIGFTHGVTHTEIKLTAAGPRIIEINGRLGGFVGDIMRRSGAPDPVRTALLTALERREPEDDARAPERIAFQWLLPCPQHAATVSAVSGLEQIGALDGVQSVQWNAPPGTVLDWREGTRSHLGVVFGTAPDHAALTALREQISTLLKVEFDSGPKDRR